MKVLLYTEGLKYVGKSGLGKAINHQMRALDSVKIPYTLDVDDDYDIVHINTYGPYTNKPFESLWYSFPISKRWISG